MGEFFVAAGGTFTGAIAAMILFALFMQWQGRRQLKAMKQDGFLPAIPRPCCPECRGHLPLHGPDCSLNPPCDICGPHNGQHSPACPNAPDYEAIHGHPPPTVPGDEWKNPPDSPSDWEKNRGA